VGGNEDKMDIRWVGMRINEDKMDIRWMEMRINEDKMDIRWVDGGRSTTKIGKILGRWISTQPRA
jgi:hypothetical protein